MFERAMVQQDVAPMIEVDAVFAVATARSRREALAVPEVHDLAPTSSRQKIEHGSDLQFLGGAEGI